MMNMFRLAENVVSENRRRFMRALFALLCVISFGTAGILVVEDHWTVWNALYFTLITITTVGYGDMGLSEAGQRFTTLLLVLGIATSTYAFSQIVQAAIGYQLDWRSRMQRKIDQLSGHCIVCGAGRVGRAVCERLMTEGKSVVVIEIMEGNLEWAQEHGMPFLVGCATDDDVLRLAGIERAYGLVGATSSDADNISICLGARELNPGMVIVSRADDVDSIRKLERAGASHVVAPALDGGRELASLLVHPHVSSFLRDSYLAESDYRVTAVPIEGDSSLVDCTPREIGVTEPTLVFVAVQRKGAPTQIPPRPDVPFEAGDIVIVVGDPIAVGRMADAARTRASMETDTDQDPEKQPRELVPG